ASESQMMHKRPKSAATSQSAPKIPGEKIAKITKTLSNHTPNKGKHIAQTGTPAATLHRTTRYIRVTIKRAALAITNGKCAHEGCNKPYEILHHVIRFAADRSHESIIPLCKEHHEFAHNRLLKEDGAGWRSCSCNNEMSEVSGMAGGTDMTDNVIATDKTQMDLLYKKYRLAALS
ncbi:MAG: hypothetical protein WCT53_06060, partial [Candidatus Gracilibacteria bacterium]